MTEIVTRFAPRHRLPAHRRRRARRCSTGSMRAAQRRQFLLRIEDTDRERSTERGDRRRSSTASNGLASTGTASRSTSSRAPSAIARWPSSCSARGRPITATHAEELSAMRESARAEGRSTLYNGRWRDRDPREAPAGVKPVIRLKAPLSGETVVEDQVQGRVSCRTRTSTISCCCAATARRPTCSPSWSTTTTWASPTSSAATTT